MFVGHLAVSLGAKALVPRAPLAALVAASFGIDLVWPVLLLTGSEVVQVAPGNTAFTPLLFEYYPWSHSLLMVLVWGVAAWGYRVRERLFDRSRCSLAASSSAIGFWIL